MTVYCSLKIVGRGLEMDERKYESGVEGTVERETIISSVLLCLSQIPLNLLKIPCNFLCLISNTS